MIKVENLTHSFGELLAVDRVSFEVRDGEILSLIGPNGAGKTTVLNVLAGILLPDSGSVFINGIDLFKRPAEGKKLSAYIPEQPYLWGKLTGLEFLLFTKSVYESSKSKEEIESIMSDFGIYDFRDRLIETYSHGMKQKLLFLTIPVIEPRVILLDEPLVGLDPRASIKITKMIRGYSARGASVLISTHDLPFAEEISDKVAIIDEGRIILQGETKMMLENHKVSLSDIFLKETSERN